MGGSKRPTIQDITNSANVSTETIDKVIHNRGKVSPVKMKNIEEAIKVLDISPNLLARAFRVLGSDLVEENVFEIKNGGIDFLTSQRSIFQGVQTVQVLFDLFVPDKLPSKIQYVPLDIIIKGNVDYYIDP